VNRFHFVLVAAPFFRGPLLAFLVKESSFFNISIDEAESVAATFFCVN